MKPNFTPGMWPRNDRPEARSHPQCSTLA